LRASRDDHDPREPHDLPGATSARANASQDENAPVNPHRKMPRIRGGRA
jgi:hypothetical protein